MTVLGLYFNIEMEWKEEKLKEIHSLILRGCDIAVTGQNCERVKTLLGISAILSDCLEYA